jgi:branched-chain amino acid transport system substrate-binding protein
MAASMHRDAKTAMPSATGLLDDTTTPLKAGAIFMFSGGVAELGQDSFDGANAAVHLVNDEGGVGGRRIEWVKADGSTPEEAARQAEHMIRDHGVRAIIGCYGSNHSIEVSKVCERLGAVLWVQTAWTSTLFDHKPRFTFRTNNYATLVEEAAVEFVVRDALPRLGKTKEQMRAAIINEGSAYGVSCGEETTKSLRARSIKPVLTLTYDARYDGSTLDFDGTVERVRRADPDVLFASSFIWDSIGLLKAMRRAGWRPPIIITSSAGFGLYTLNLAGEMAEGILSSNAPALIAPAALSERGRRLQREYVSRLKGLTGREPSGFNAMAFCAAYSLFRDVLPRASSLNDPEAIRTAAVETDVPLGDYPNGWGLKFDALGQNTRCPSSIDQWQDGALRTVWPPEWATSRLHDLPLPRLS